MAIQPEVTEGGSRQRVLVLTLAGVLLLLLVGLLARPLLKGGSAAPPAPPATAAATPTTVAQLISPSTSVAGPTGTAKDPFRPVVAAGGTETSGVTATTVGTTTVSGSGTAAERRVVLQDVSSRSGTRYVKVAVSGASYTATEGERFANDYRVVDIGGTCAVFEAGSGRFTLCEGEAIQK
ncbi:MAG TPA: hypothetical protein VFU54_04530 [Actinomycetota bacterium]|nr:hypothetical protein [Actinomycetota bacterium]